MKCFFLLWCIILFGACASSSKFSDKSVFDFDFSVSEDASFNSSDAFSDNSVKSSSDSSYSNSMEYHFVFDTDKLDDNGNAPVKEMSLIFFNSGSIRTEDLLVDKFKLGNFSSNFSSVVNDKEKIEKNIIESKLENKRFHWKLSFFLSVLALLIIYFRKYILKAFINLLFKFKL